jgi:hypothetical protein
MDNKTKTAADVLVEMNDDIKNNPMLELMIKLILLRRSKRNIPDDEELTASETEKIISVSKNNSSTSPSDSTPERTKYELPVAAPASSSVPAPSTAPTPEPSSSSAPETTTYGLPAHEPSSAPETTTYGLPAHEPSSVPAPASAPPEGKCIADEIKYDDYVEFYKKNVKKKMMLKQRKYIIIILKRYILIKILIVQQSLIKRLDC